jgi:hypothetical protein
MPRNAKFSTGTPPRGNASTTTSSRFAKGLNLLAS